MAFTLCLGLCDDKRGAGCSKNRVAQENELLCKVLAYNLTVLIHQAFENGIDLGCLKQKSGQEAL